MARENLPGDDRIVATGATGLGISALVAAVHRKFITRDQGLGRLEKLLSFLERAPRYHGAWSHYYNEETGETMPLFGMYDNGGDIIETSYVIQGLLTARGYFDRKDAREKSLRERITALWEAVEWDWFRMTPDSPFLYWHWSPQWGHRIQHPLIGFNETVPTYLFAIASPTHPVPASMYYSGWASQDKRAQDYRQGWSGSPDGRLYANGNTYFGIKLDVGVSTGGPLFFIHYIFMGFDPRELRDRYTDSYFENSRAIAEINRAYCIANPKGFKGYGANAWGLTASFGWNGYTTPAPDQWNDDGTITLTGRAGVVSLHARGVDGRLQAFLPGARRRALGHLRSPRQLQPQPGLARLPLHGPQPGADRRDGREPSHAASCGARSCRIPRSARC